MSTIVDLLVAAAAVNTSDAFVIFDSAEVVTAETGEVNSGNDVVYDTGAAGDITYLIIIDKVGAVLTLNRTQWL